MKTIITFKISAVFLFLTSFLATDNLVYRDVEGGLVKMLVPADFKYQSKAAYKPQYEGDGAPDDYFSNQDRSEEVQIAKWAGMGADISSIRPMINDIIKTSGKKVYFNDVVTINGIKAWVLEFDGTDGPMLKYNKYVFFNAGGTSYLAATSSLPQMKNKWKPVSDRILNSIKAK